MILFLRRIPANTTRHELNDFIRPIIKGGIFEKSGKIIGIKILVLKDLELNALEFHGLVTVDSDIAFQRVVSRLNGKVFKGKNIGVRGYIERTWHNDPRVNLSHWNKNLVNKRRCDRRRSKIEEVADLTNRFSSSNGFHRML